MDLSPIIIVPIFFVLLLSYSVYRLIKDMRESQRMKSEFISIIAHKFRTPLSAGKWIIENMSSNEHDASKRESLNEMRKINEHLVSITNTMIELADSDKASRGGYSFERTDMCSFIRTVSEEYNLRFHEKNIFFSMRCVEKELYAKIDKPRFEFVIQTLLENACTYTPPGRNVEVVVSPTRQSFRRKVVISVNDGGIGIDPADARKIFTKFFRADNARSADTEGFGVGLFLARSIARRHYGKMVFSSEGLGKGSLFQVIIPRVR
jgi:signal transduction histidine kinase